MKIKVLSDIHREFADLDIPFDGEEVLILAGDIQIGIPDVDWHVKLLEHRNVISIFGNHEHYHRDIDNNYATVTGRIAEINLRAEDLGYKFRMSFLCNNHVIVDNVKFFGGTLWTDMMGESSFAIDHAPRMMNDFRIIKKGDGKFSALDSLEEHKITASYIEKELDMEDGYKKVVITHHLPSFESVDKQYIPDPKDRYFKEKSAMNYYFCSDLDHLVERADVWIHGHTHSSKDFKIGKCRVICNPRGYNVRGVNENKDFNPNLIIEI